MSRDQRISIFSLFHANIIIIIINIALGSKDSDGQKPSGGNKVLLLQVLLLLIILLLL